MPHMSAPVIEKLYTFQEKDIMKIKLIAALLLCTFLNGCASTSEKAARDFLDGANSSSESRHKEELNTRFRKKPDQKNDFIEDTMSGALTALFRGIFNSDDDND